MDGAFSPIPPRLSMTASPEYHHGSLQRSVHGHAASLGLAFGLFVLWAALIATSCASERAQAGGESHARQRRALGLAVVADGYELSTLSHAWSKMEAARAEQDPAGVDKGAKPTSAGAPPPPGSQPDATGRTSSSLHVQVIGDLVGVLRELPRCAAVVMREARDGTGERQTGAWGPWGEEEAGAVGTRTGDSDGSGSGSSSSDLSETGFDAGSGDEESSDESSSESELDGSERAALPGEEAEQHSQSTETTSNSSSPQLSPLVSGSSAIMSSGASSSSGSDDDLLLSPLSSSSSSSSSSLSSSSPARAQDTIICETDTVEHAVKCARALQNAVGRTVVVVGRDAATRSKRVSQLAERIAASASAHSGKVCITVVAPRDRADCAHAAATIALLPALLALPHYEAHRALQAINPHATRAQRSRFLELCAHVAKILDGLGEDAPQYCIAARCP